MQADRIAAEHGRLTVARDAIGAVGDARPAGGPDDPFAAAGELLGLDAGEERPLEGPLPPLRGCLPLLPGLHLLSYRPLPS